MQMKVTVLGLCAVIAIPAIADQLLIRTPEQVVFGQCRPVNITMKEMQRQLALYEGHSLNMRESRDLSLSEEIAQVKMGFSER